MTDGRADREVARIAAANRGPFTHRGARDAGLSNRQIELRLDAEAWKVALPRVYVHAATRLSTDVMHRAALLWAGPTSVLSHRCAGEAWKLDGISHVQPEILVEGARHPRSKLVISHRTLSFGPSDVRRVDGLRVTSPTRTVIDLASVLDLPTLRIAFESARRRRLTTVDQVRARLDGIGGAGRPGAAQLERLLCALRDREASESPLEVKVAELLDSARLPPPVTQHHVAIGRRVYRLDFAWPSSRVALECDGRQRHVEDSDFQRDRNRWSDLAAVGWRLVFATWRDVRDEPDRIVERVRVALAA